MSGSRRLGVLVVSIGILWYACSVGFWAVRSFDDAVPVGIDYTGSAPKATSVTVKCHSLFAGAARDASPLPALKPQPPTAPPLAFQRTPCSLPHRQARLVFALDSLALLAALGVGGWVLRPHRESSEAPVMAGSAVG